MKRHAKNIKFNVITQTIVGPIALRSLICGLFALASPLALAQPTTEAQSDAPSKAATNDTEDESIIKLERDSTEYEIREFSNADIRKACKKFSGKIASTNGDLWRVTTTKDGLCERHQIQDPDFLFNLTKRGMLVIETDPRDLGPISIGPTVEQLEAKKQRPCSQFHGRYVTHSYTDIYYVENCTKRLIPDYETLNDHRKASKTRSKEILALTDREFYALKQGRDLASVMEKEFEKITDGRAGVEIIPVDEACRGLEGKTVSFYSRLYKIEKCRKREINPEAYTLKNRGRDLRLVELQPEQWVSLPDGKPLDL